MEVILTILMNPWVISFTAAIIVYAVSEYVKIFREKKQYKQQVELANKEIISSLVNTIPEGELPSISTLFSIHKATAKKYNVSIDDMDSLTEIFDSIIKEIVDSNFLSYGDKIIYCDRIEDVKSKVNLMKLEISNKHMADKNINISIGWSPSVFPIIAAMMAFIVMVTLSVQDIVEIAENNKEVIISVEQYAAIVSLLMVSAIIFLIRYILVVMKKRNEKRKNKWEQVHQNKEDDFNK